MANKKKVLIVDSSSMIYRAYYGSITWSNDPVQSGKSLYHKWLTKIKDEVKPKLRFSAIDYYNRESKNFELCDNYKAGRHTPDDLKENFKSFHVLEENEGFLIAKKRGEEADDVIASLIEKLKYPVAEFYVVSMDKDILQLVDDQVTVIRFKKENHKNILEYLDKEHVCNEFGIDDPKKIVDLKALIGDGSDGYHGIKGIGIRRAQKLLREYNDLDGIYQALSEGKITGAISRYLESGKEDAEKCYQLAKLNRNLFKKV